MVFVYNLVDPTRLLLFSCFLFRQNEFYSNFLERMGFSLGGLTLSSFLRKMGCPGSLALVILSLLGVFFGSESALINWMNSSGSASGSASESWQKYLNLSEENAASEPSTSHTPPNPEPEAPSISFLRERIKNVIRSCQRIRKSKILKRINEDLHLETASAEKRVKIAQVLDNINWKRVLYLYGGT